MDILIMHIVSEEFRMRVTHTISSWAVLDSCEINTLALGNLVEVFITYWVIIDS